MEMNAFLAQSIQARNELKHIANVRYQIVSATNSSPIIGCHEDTITGAYVLTKNNIKFKGYELANLLCNTFSYEKDDTTKEIMKNFDMNKEYTGHEAFSYIIPKGINNISKLINIVDGKLISGELNKKALSYQKNSIIHFIWDKFGASKSRKFIDDAQRFILNVLLMTGLTSGFNDFIFDNKVHKQINEIISNKILQVKYNITQFENDMEQLPLNIIEDSLSGDIDTIVGESTKVIMNGINPNNFFLLAASSGSKGDSNKITQTLGVIGQTYMENSRIKKKVEGRSMIYFHTDDDTPEARGFIKNSFLSGLRGYEVFYNSMAGRSGLIDTAIKTGQTGYIQRQLIKSLEDLSIKYDGTIRNAKGTIIQMIYGENGINQATQTELQLNIINMNNKTLEDKLGLSVEQIKKVEKALKISNNEIKIFNNKYIKKIKELRDEFRKIQMYALLNFKVLEDKYMLPINLFRITQDYTNQNKNNNASDLSPIYVEQMIEKFLTDYDNRLISSLKETDKYMTHDDRCLKFLLEVALNEYLAPVRCIFDYGLTKKDFDNMMKDIKLSYIKALIEPGEMIGIIAAQSLGEPTSQMTLHSKHNVGKANKNALNSGVPRIQELLHYSKNIKTPQTVVYFKPEYSNDKSMVNKISSYFKHLTIRSLIESAEVYYDLGLNDKFGKIIKNDNVLNPFYVNNQKVDINSLPFVFRIKMDIEKMLEKETTTLDIKTKIISHWYKYYNNLKTLSKNEKEVVSKISRCVILSNNPTDEEQIIHIRFNMTSFNNSIITEFVRMIFDDITLKGIQNIDGIDVKHELSLKMDKESGEMKSDKEYVIYTAGINFEKLLMIKGLDLSRTSCNDIATIFRLYGIEAARQILINEFRITYQSNVNQNHLAVLVDQMCYLGEIISIDRHGSSKVDLDPIARATFERQMEHFINASIFNEKDSIKSVSSSVAVGKVINGGTGCFDILLDTKKLENSEYTEDETRGRVTFTALEEEPLVQDIMKYGHQHINFLNPN